MKVKRRRKEKYIFFFNSYGYEYIQETLNLSTDADISTDTKADRTGPKGLFLIKKKKNVFLGGGFILLAESKKIFDHKKCPIKSVRKKSTKSVHKKCPQKMSKKCFKKSTKSVHKK